MAQKGESQQLPGVGVGAGGGGRCRRRSELFEGAAWVGGGHRTKDEKEKDASWLLARLFCNSLDAVHRGAQGKRLSPSYFPSSLTVSGPQEGLEQKEGSPGSGMAAL